MKFLNLQKHRLSPIVFRPHCKVQPDSTVAILFYQDFVIVLPGLIGIVHQDHRIAQGLLDTSDTDIHGTPRQMITRRRSAYLLIQLRAPIATVDDDWLFGIYITEGTVLSLYQKNRPFVIDADVLRAKVLYSGIKWDWNFHPN